jgi:hypothetical protein
MTVSIIATVFAWRRDHIVIIPVAGIAGIEQIDADQHAAHACWNNDGAWQFLIIFPVDSRATDGIINGQVSVGGSEAAAFLNPKAYARPIERRMP